jgi:hypothetical protein
MGTRGRRKAPPAPPPPAVIPRSPAPAPAPSPHSDRRDPDPDPFSPGGSAPGSGRVGDHDSRRRRRAGGGKLPRPPAVIPRSPAPTPAPSPHSDRRDPDLHAFSPARSAPGFQAGGGHDSRRRRRTGVGKLPRPPCRHPAVAGAGAFPHLRTATAGIRIPAPFSPAGAASGFQAWWPRFAPRRERRAGGGKLPRPPCRHPAVAGAGTGPFSAQRPPGSGSRPLLTGRVSALDSGQGCGHDSRETGATSGRRKAPPAPHAVIPRSPAPAPAPSPHSDRWDPDPDAFSPGGSALGCGKGCDHDSRRDDGDERAEESSPCTPCRHPAVAGAGTGPFSAQRPSGSGF